MKRAMHTMKSHAGNPRLGGRRIVGSLFASAAVGFFAAQAAHADVVCYEYMTVTGSGQGAGVHVLTDYVPKSNTVVRAMYSLASAMASNNNQFLFCSRYGTSPVSLNFGFAPNVGGKFRFDYNGAQTGASSSFAANQIYMLEVKAGKAYVTDAASGSVVTLGSGLQSFTPQCRMALFQSYTYSGGEYGGWNNAFHGKFYYLKVFDIENGEEVLKHHFVPCLDGDVVKLCDLADSNATYALTSTSSGTSSGGASVGGKVVSGAYIVDKSGTITLAAPSSYGLLMNTAPECVFDQTGDSVSAENAHSFTGFQSYRGSGTFFKGGWWDFGAVDTVVNFFGAADGFSNRRTEFSDGAVVTNVGSVYLAGTSGINNQLRLTGASSLYAGSLVLGCAATSWQNSAVTVDDGSLLHVSGALSMTDGQVFQNSKTLSGNELVVSGAGSRLVVGGEMSLGRSISGSNATPGGNFFSVVDGAVATLKDVVVGVGTWHGEKNHMLFGKDSHVTMTSLLFGTGGSGGVTGVQSNLLEIVDGAVVTNTGALKFGDEHSSQAGNTIIVSNATFHTDIFSQNNVKYLIRGLRSKLVLSGADAMFTLASGSGTLTIFKNPGSSFVVENGATYSLPYSSYSYTLDCKQETVRFCSGATVTRTGSFATGNTYDTAGTSNRLEVADGASFTVSGAMSLIGHYSVLDVDDASFAVGNSLYVGANNKTGTDIKEFTNSTFRIAGSHPSVRVSWNLIAKSNAKMVFALPAGGYAEGAATDANPIVLVGTGSSNFTISFVENATVEFENANDFLESLERRRDYVLLKCNNTNGLQGLTEEKMAQMSAGFPKGLSLENTGKKLILHARPQRGCVISFR